MGGQSQYHRVEGDFQGQGGEKSNIQLFYFEILCSLSFPPEGTGVDSKCDYRIHKISYWLGEEKGLILKIVEL